jgi:hypothetical protein
MLGVEPPDRPAAGLTNLKAPDVADVNPLSHHYYLADIERAVRRSPPPQRPASQPSRKGEVLHRLVAALRPGQSARPA